MALDSDIAALDLECIAFKIAVDERWPIEKIDRVTEAYRTFVQAMRIHDHSFRLVPTKDIDTFWHHHILDTPKYFGDCKILFGRYIHHFPYSGLKGDEDQRLQKSSFNRSLALLQSVNPHFKE